MFKSLQLYGLYVAHQAPLSWDSPGKNIGVGCHALLQGIFLTQGSNLGLLNCRQILYYLSHQGSWYYLLKKRNLNKRKINPNFFLKRANFLKTLKRYNWLNYC